MSSELQLTKIIIIKGKIKIIGNGTVVNRDENFIRCCLMIKIEMNQITASVDMSHICESSK